MHITDLNSHGGIGANCLLLQMDGVNIVIDAGIHPKESGLSSVPKLSLLRDLEIDLIFLTHCHLDHLGALPLLAREHPATPIIMSRESEGLFQRMLRNSCRVMERQRDEKGISEYPLYNYRDINQCSHQAIGIAPGHPRLFELTSGERVTFSLHRAGHIPGAVGVLIEHRHKKLFHTADVLFEDTALLSGAHFPEGPFDKLIIETTRGATERLNPRAMELERLLDTIEQTTDRGGSILIPVFALGRMQELITFFHTARASGRLSNLPLYVSGLGIDLLNQIDRLARNNPHLHSLKRHLRELGAEKLPENHAAGKKRPSIYLLSSGMMVENTPSYMAAATLLEDERHTIAFVGYCDPDTPGGKLQASAKGEPFLFKTIEKQVEIRAEVLKFDLSSHADREELVDFAVRAQPRSILLTHGDQAARDWFKGRLGERLPDSSVVDPVPLQKTLL
jgi:Cft2 family RNA processing exonuclease